MIDLEPATTRLTAVIRDVQDEQLEVPTPCPGTSLAAMLDHIDGLSQAFRAAAVKEPLEGRPSADAARLGTDWRTRIPERLAALAQAWNNEAAWTGMTRAGGVDLPGEVAGLVALNEVVVHGWDIAVASGQPYACEPHLVHAALGFVQSAVARNPQGSPGLFGPPVTVPEDAPLLDRLIGLTGRDPTWSADRAR
jgi:uncharacterized protein (TIGR03086 family)